MTHTYSAEFHSGYRATLMVGLHGFHCVWSPDLPRDLKGADRNALLVAYRAWRDECLADFARANGLSIRTVRTEAGDAIAFSKAEVST